MISNISFNATSATSEANQLTDKISNVNKPSGMGDKVFMSESAKLVMEMLDDQQSPEDFQRIMQLQQAIESGTYVINAEKIADRLLTDMREL